MYKTYFWKIKKRKVEHTKKLFKNDVENTLMDYIHEVGYRRV